MHPDLAMPSAARRHPRRSRGFPSHWLVGIGLSCAVMLVVMQAFTPGLFVVVAPLILLCLGLAAVAGVATLLNPPDWADVGLIVLAFALMDTSLRKGGVEAGSFDVQSVFKGMVWVVVLVYGLLHGWRGLLRHPVIICLGLYAVMATASALYSPSRLLGLGSGTALLALAAYAAHVSRWERDKVHRLWRALFWAVVTLAVVSLATYAAVPDWARDYRASGAGRLRGVTGSGNSLASLLCIGLIAGVYALRTANGAAKRVAAGLGLSTMIVALALTESRGATVGLLAAFVVVAAIGRPLLALGAALAALAGLWVVTQPHLFGALLQGLAGTVARSGQIDEITTFTGRSEIWAALLPRIAEHPWIGYGLGSARVVVSESYATRWGHTFESAHNWMLESLISMGVVGTVVLFVFLVQLLVLAWRLRRGLRSGETPAIDAPLAHALLRCWVFLAVSGLVEKSFAGMPSPSTVLLAVMAGSAVALTAASRAGALASSEGGVPEGTAHR